MKIKFIALGLILFTFFGCCNDCKKELELIKQDLRKPFNFDDASTVTMTDFCRTNEALTPTRTHNTRTGISKFTIPIPKGSHLKLIKKSKKSLIYECRGKVFKDDVFFRNMTVTGMSEEEGAQIEVIVKFVGFVENQCPENKIMLTDPKKSIINGNPIGLNKKNSKE